MYLRTHRTWNFSSQPSSWLQRDTLDRREPIKLPCGYVRVSILRRGLFVYVSAEIEPFFIWPYFNAPLSGDPLEPFNYSHWGCDFWHRGPVIVFFGTFFTLFKNVMTWMLQKYSVFKAMNLLKKYITLQYIIKFSYCWLCSENILSNGSIFIYCLFNNCGKSIVGVFTW